MAAAIETIKKDTASSLRWHLSEFVHSMTAGRQSGSLERLIPRSFLLFVLLLQVSVDSLWALDPTQPVSNYIRDHFTEQQGLPSSVVDSIVQSQDGFLWLIVNGSMLTRFDGRRFFPFAESITVWALAMAPNGDLWAGTREDLKRIPAAALNQFENLAANSYHPGPGAGSANSLHFSRSGVLWVATRAGLYRFEHEAFSLAIPGVRVLRIEEASNGHLWLMVEQGVLEWDGSRAIQHPELAAQLGLAAKDIFHIFEDSHGVTWFCTANGVARRMAGSIEKLAPWGPHGHGAFRAYEDPQGAIWFAKAEGLFRATQTGLELAVAGMNVRSIFGDRDGNLWVGTNGDGLYRFKDRAARMFTIANGLPNDLAMTVLATHDGAVWSGFNCGGIARFDGQRFQIYNEKNGLFNSCVTTLAEDINHDLWIGTLGGGVFRFRGGRFKQYSQAEGLSSNFISEIIPAHDGSIWLRTQQGASRIRDGEVRNYTKADGLSEVYLLYEDRTGGIWAGTYHGVDHLAGDRFENFSSFPRTLAFAVGEDHSGALYFSVGPDAELYRLKNNQVIQVATDLQVSTMVETEQGDLWLTSPFIVHLPPGALDRPYRQDDPVDFAPFGPGDGLGSAQTSAGRPPWALTRDGKLWIATLHGLAMLDLPRLPRTDRKPAIYMQEVTIGRNQQAPGHELILQPGTHHLELQFDAIELSSPEKIRLQYRLDNTDSEWLDANPPGHASYSTLPPGTHAFHVRACNRSGIWDRAGMVYYITQQPYFYQTRWFLVVTIAFGLLMIAGVYQVRMRQVARTLSARFEGQLAERTRIARELHDTLLQSFSALLLRLQSVSKILPARPEDAKQRVDGAIEQVSSAIAEGRDAVHELRSRAPADNDLAQAIGNLGKELLSGPLSENSPEFRVQVEGTPRNLNPMVRDEAYRITAEALRNAVTHAKARRIEVEIRYDEQQLRVRIRDDGKGIDLDLLEHGRAPGHWGLRGMRERAKLVGGNLEVWSEVGSGSEVELTIPSAKAYAKPASHWPFFSRSWRSKRS